VAVDFDVRVLIDREPGDVFFPDRVSLGVELFEGGV
jgi:hypothetical protein